MAQQVPNLSTGVPRSQDALLKSRMYHDEQGAAICTLCTLLNTLTLEHKPSQVVYCSVDVTHLVRVKLDYPGMLEEGTSNSPSIAAVQLLVQHRSVPFRCSERHRTDQGVEQIGALNTCIQHHGQQINQVSRRITQSWVISLRVCSL